MKPEIVWAAFALAQAADIITTRNGIDRGGAEANPIIRFMMRILGRAWWVGKLAIAGAGAWYVATWFGVEYVWIITAITAIIATMNTRVGR